MGPKNWERDKITDRTNGKNEEILGVPQRSESNKRLVKEIGFHSSIPHARSMKFCRMWRVVARAFMCLD